MSTTAPIERATPEMRESRSLVHLATVCLSSDLVIAARSRQEFTLERLLCALPDEERREWVATLAAAPSLEGSVQQRLALEAAQCQMSALAFHIRRGGEPR